MTRTPALLRTAVVSDAPALVDLWHDTCRRADRGEQVADLEVLVKTADESPEQRLLVAERDDEVVGAVLVRLATLSPINPEPCVLVHSPTVAPRARHKGIGRMLMEAAVAFGDELGVAHVATAVEPGARDANRFMARLGLGPKATLRVAPLATVQSKVQPKSATTGRAPSGRQIGQILAARRSMRRPSALPAALPPGPPADTAH